MKSCRKAVEYLICAAMLAAVMVGCANGTDEPGDTSDAIVTSDPETTDTEAETTDTETAEPVTSEPETTETEPPETEPEPEEPEEPENLNPLTGLESDIDLTTRRPAAIMINNIRIATPQEGISYADVMYECVVEGWQTRLMMLSMEYEALPVVGSVRSSREYFLDFAANHDAIYIHAGGSAQAYAEIKARRVNNLDGVNMYIPNMFYRDSWRQVNMGLEHSLMTTGEKIADGIAYMKYHTEIVDNFDSPLDFVPYGTTRVPEGGDATYLKVKYSSVHQPYFEYNADEGVYYRWQFLGEEHMDNTANVQLSFTNVIVLYLPSVSTGDKYNHMDVTTTGTGEGYYLSGGKYETITWSKADEDTPVKLYDANGEELLINRGKTFFQICTTSMQKTTELR